MQFMKKKFTHFIGIISLLYELFPFEEANGSHFMQRLNENNIYFSHYLFKNRNVVTTLEFFICYKIIL
jgi:hypothetical protein